MLRTLLGFGALLLFAIPLAAETGHDWPQFRGVHRDGISPETGLLGRWPEAGPKEAWRRPLGEGYSGISVVGERLYTMFAADHEGEPMELAAAFDAGSGKELWRVPIGPKKDTEFGNGPRSTPTVDGDTVFVLGSEGDFAALATADGAVRWKIKLTDVFESSVPYWGFSSSVLVEGNTVLVEGGGKEGKSWAGLDRKTGKIEWTTGDAPANYNSPLPVTVNGKKRFVRVAGKKITAIDAKGKEIWSTDWPEGESHATPVFIEPDMLFASGTEGIGGRMFRIREEGGSASVEELWHNRFMRNHFSSSVVHDGHLYGFDNATLKCISVEDGKLAWAKRGLGKGSLIFADGHLLVLSDRGDLLLVEASPDGYVEKGRTQAFDGRTWTAPTLANGRLYLRDHAEMVAYELKR